MFTSQFRRAKPLTLTGAVFAGLFVSVFFGFWCGGAHAMGVQAAQNAAVFAQGTATVPGVVTGEYRSDSDHKMGYSFALKSGQMFVGQYTAKDYRPAGAPVQVEYAVHDPMVSHVVGQPPPGPQPLWFELAGLVMGVVILAGILVRMAQLGAPVVAVLGFTVLCLACGAAMVGVGGSVMSGRHYTVQVGDQAWTTDGSQREVTQGATMQVKDGQLTVNGRGFGPVPDRAHLWFRNDGIFVNGRLVPGSG